MKLTALFSMTELGEAQEQGWVRRATHPTLPLVIVNYTEKAAYEGAWNNVTMQCRGLIHNLDGDVVARPFRKFFNVGEPHAPDLPLDEMVSVTDKLDGSLGILYPYVTVKGRWCVASRGSFISDQAVHATELWERDFAPRFTPALGVTYLFEIVYPENRIVVDYGGLDDLILLAALDIETGLPIAELDWPGRRADVHAHRTLQEALEAPPRVGVEGYVVYFPLRDVRVKIKQDDYVRLHRIIFGLTARRLWENAGAVDLVHGHGYTVKQAARTLFADPAQVQLDVEQAHNGDWLAPLLMDVPEEFETWITAVSRAHKAQVESFEAKVGGIFLARDLGSWKDRGQAAKVILEHEEPVRSALFSLLDDRPIRHIAWRSAQPEHETFAQQNEEVA